MEKLKTDIGGKLKLLLFTLSKTQGVLESGNVLAINRHREALSTIVSQIDIWKLQVIEERFKEGDFEEDIAKWSTEIENQVAQFDIKVAHINEHLAFIKSDQETEKEFKAKECEDQLKFERVQPEKKLEYERKIEESKKNYATKTSEAKASPTSEGARTTLPELTITKFNGSHTDWLRFWNIYEAEINKCSDMAAVTKFGI